MDENLWDASSLDQKLQVSRDLTRLVNNFFLLSLGKSFFFFQTFDGLWLSGDNTLTILLSTLHDNKSSYRDEQPKKNCVGLGTTSCVRVSQKGCPGFLFVVSHSSITIIGKSMHIILSKLILFIVVEMY